MQFLLFTVANQLSAVDLAFVDRVEMASTLLAIPLNEVSHLKCGMINIHGKITPVVSLRNLLGLPKKEIELNDRFIICNFEGNFLALWVDSIEGVKEINNDSIVSSEHILSESCPVNQVIKEADRIILIWNFNSYSGKSSTLSSLMGSK